MKNGREPKHLIHTVYGKKLGYKAIIMHSGEAKMLSNFEWSFVTKNMINIILLRRCDEIHKAT